jgi:hypothetical protein
MSGCNILGPHDNMHIPDAEGSVALCTSCQCGDHIEQEYATKTKTPCSRAQRSSLSAHSIACVYTATLLRAVTNSNAIKHNDLIWPPRHHGNQRHQQKHDQKGTVIGHQQKDVVERDSLRKLEQCQSCMCRLASGLLRPNP